MKELKEMEKLQDNTVIVVDTSNYKASYSEDVPFKALITQKYDNELWVKSLTTGKEYELYYDQILEGLEIEEIANMINMLKYGAKI